MSVHGCSFAEYADSYTRMNLNDAKYLGFRDMPDLLQKYTNGKYALDFGCGHGKSAEFLKKLGFTVDGVDINEHMIDLAHKAFPDGNFQVIREGRIPANDGQYDLVFASWVLQDIGPKDELLATLAEITRVLKKGGTFIAIVNSEWLFGRDWTFANAEFEENKNLKSGDRGKFIFKESNLVSRLFFWTEKDYRDGLTKVGLDVILVYEPLGREDEGFAWINEKEFSPYTIYVSKKKVST